MISVVLSLGLGFLIFEVPGRRRGAHQTGESAGNLRQIGLALLEFDTDFGRFPDSSTIAQVKERDPSTTIPLGLSTSNELFRQLLVTEVAPSESMFYSRPPGSGPHRRPDNNFVGTNALEKGECGFAYIAGLSTTSHPPDTPLAMAPLVPGQRKFDYKHCKEFFGGKAVILCIDCSVRSLPVDKSGRVWINGKDLFDPSQPFWGGKAPDVKWPE
jgi:hypothetical protein